MALQAHKSVAFGLFQRFSRFLGVGAIGFVVDFGVFAFAIEVLSLAPIPARLIAFISAATLTWALNRRYTFADRASAGRTSELGRYALSSAVAGAANLAVYSVILFIFGAAWPIPYLALAIGVGAGLLINFGLYNKIVFRKPHAGKALNVPPRDLP